MNLDDKVLEQNSCSETHFDHIIKQSIFSRNKQLKGVSWLKHYVTSDFLGLKAIKTKNLIWETISIFVFHLIDQSANCLKKM